MRFTRPKWLELWGWLLLALSLAEWWSRAVNGGEIENYINADIAYLPAVIEDVVIRGNPFFNSWYPTPAPYLFPDGLLYLVPRLLFGRIESAQLAAALAQVILLGLASRQLFSALSGPSINLSGLGPGLLSVGVALGLDGHAPFNLLYVPAYHTGVVILAFTISALLLESTKRFRGIATVLCVLGALSDSLLVVGFGLAVSFLSVVAFIPRVRRRLPAAMVQLARSGALVGVSCLLGMMGRRFILPRAPRSHEMLRINDFVAVVKRAWVDWHEFDSVFRGLFVVGIVVFVALAWRGSTWHRRIFGVLFFLTSINTIGGILLTSNLNFGWYRYLLLPALAAVFAVGLWVNRLLPAVSVMLVASGLVGLAISPSKWALRAPPDFRMRADMACIDAMANRFGGKVVLTDYWAGKPLTLLSSADLRAAQFAPDLSSPYLAITSREWYRPARDASLVIANRLDPAVVAEKFGPPVEKKFCGEHEVLAYQGDGQTRLAAFIEATVSN